MSIEKSVNLKCDRLVFGEPCGMRFEGGRGETPRDVKKAAKAEGWKLGKQKDFCPKCSAEIAETIKQAASGQ